MKLSTKTISILKSFTTINQGLHFKKGNILTTVHPQKVIMGQAIIEDNLPQDFTIYNLNSFLGVLNLLKDPELEFKQDRVVIKNGNVSVNYGFADPSSVKEAPDKEIKLKPDVKFEISAEQLDSVLRASAVMQLSHLKIEGNGSKIKLVAFDPKDPSANSYTIDTKETTDKNFSFLFKLEDVQILPGSYEVGVTITQANAKAGHFKCKELPIQYWVTLQKDSVLTN